MAEKRRVESRVKRSENEGDVENLIVICCIVKRNKKRKAKVDEMLLIYMSKLRYLIC